MVSAIRARAREELAALLRGSPGPRFLCLRQSRGERTRSAPCTASELEAATLQGALLSGAFSRVSRVAPRFCALPSAVVGPSEDCRRGSAGLWGKLEVRVE